MGRPGPVVGGDEPTVGTGDWRSQLAPASRQRIVNKIMDTLKGVLPFSGQEGLQERAVGIEEMFYTSATSQPDYLRKISLKMLTIVKNPENAMSNFSASNSENNIENSTHTGDYSNGN